MNSPMNQTLDRLHRLAAQGDADASLALQRHQARRNATPLLPCADITAWMPRQGGGRCMSSHHNLDYSHASKGDGAGGWRDAYGDGRGWGYGCGDPGNGVGKGR